MDARLANLTSEQRATLATVTASHLLDSDRWLMSYVTQTATQLRRRVLATQNGAA